MPYGKLAEGARVFTAVAGPAASADINEIQDQLLAMCGPRTYSIPLCAFTSPPGSGFVLDESQDPLRWEEETHTSGSYLMIPVVVPSGCKITQADVWIIGTASQTGGSIKLIRQKNDGSAARDTVADMDSSDPWAVVAITKITTGAITATVDSNYNYWIEIINATGGPIADNYVYGASFVAQFGN